MMYLLHKSGPLAILAALGLTEVLHLELVGWVLVCVVCLLVTGERVFRWLNPSKSWDPSQCVRHREILMEIRAALAEFRREVDERFQAAADARKEIHRAAEQLHGRVSRLEGMTQRVQLHPPDNQP